MRVTLFLTGVIICLVGLGLSSRGPHPGTALATHKPFPMAQPVRPGQTPEPSWAVTVTGPWELKRELAAEVALDEAVTKVRDYLRERNPPVDWTPTPKYLCDHLLQDLRTEDEKTAEPREVTTRQVLIYESRWAIEEQKRYKEPGGDVRLYRVRLRVQVSPQGLTEIRALSHQEHVHQRKERMEQRMLPLARLLVGLIALLGAVAGYVRLDEWSKGYYRTWLRLGATGLVAATWAGLSWPVLYVVVRSFLGE